MLSKTKLFVKTKLVGKEKRRSLKKQEAEMRNLECFSLCNVNCFRCIIVALPDATEHLGTFLIIGKIKMATIVSNMLKLLS